MDGWVSGALYCQSNTGADMTTKPTTVITMKVEVWGNTPEEVREHLEAVREELEGLFEINLKSMATIEDIKIEEKS